MNYKLLLIIVGTLAWASEELETTCELRTLQKLDSCTDTTGTKFDDKTTSRVSKGTVCIHDICGVFKHAECALNGRWVGADGIKIKEGEDYICQDYKINTGVALIRKKRGMFRRRRRRSPPAPPPPPLGEDSSKRLIRKERCALSGIMIYSLECWEPLLPWLPTLPSFTECGHPGIVSNSSVILTTTSQGGTATYTCNYGYNHTAGDITRTCQSNSLWSGTEPTCSYMNSCSSNPCFNGGTCIDIPDSYTCKCLSIWKGLRCEQEMQCGDEDLLSELKLRARNYEAEDVRGSDPYVNDQTLSSNWYGTIIDKDQYLMPDSRVKPEHNVCGTWNPIYIKGNHPDVTTLTKDPVQVVTCELDSSNNCTKERTIELRKCGDHVVYYLTRTEQDAAYCFDPPEIQNVAQFDKAPTDITFGKFTVQPELRFQEVGDYLLPYLQFNCMEDNSGTDTRSVDLYYFTYWFINSELADSYVGNTSTALAENNIIAKGYDKLGIYIRCGVRISKSNIGLKTSMASSKDFFAGVEVANATSYIDKDKTAYITLRPTVPYGCYAKKDEHESGKCVLPIRMLYPGTHGAVCNGGEIHTDTYHTSNQAICSLEFKGYYPQDVHTVPNVMTQSETMHLSAPYFSDSDPLTYRISLVVAGSNGHQIWKNYKLEEAQIHVNEFSRYKRKLCYSHVDPHMKTADGKSYENQAAGEFILYWNTENNIMVQERTTRCNNGRAYCACAVAVRAGAEVFLINLCKGKKFIGMTSCENSGLLVVQKYSDFDYKVQTNIGTLVSIIIRPYRGYENLMNIDIHMAPKDYNNIRGLCGTFDSNTANDFKDRNGKIVSRLAFINSWRRKTTDTNLLEETCSHSISSWGEQELPMYCICNSYYINCTDKDKCKDEPMENATCSPSPYFNCTFTRQKTDLCEDYHDRCNDAARHKRSVSPDPEQEIKDKTKRLLDMQNRRVDRIQKRSVDSAQISREDAESVCRDAIVNSLAVTKHSEQLGGFNYTIALQECTFDVYEGQDPGWIEAYQAALNDAVKVVNSRDINYTDTHQDEIRAFNRQTCPVNCSGNGICSDEGICECVESYFGPYCENPRTEGPVIDDMEGSGICDTRYGSECRCVEVQTNYLYEEFQCKRIQKRKTIDGSTEEIGTEIIPGHYRNIFAGECCFSNGRRKRSLDENTDNDTMNYEYEVSLSNNGVDFGPVVTLYMFDSKCQNVTIYSNMSVVIEMKNNTCIIGGTCFEESQTHLTDMCGKCRPAISQFSLTYDCPASDNELNVVAIIAVCVTSGILATALIVIAVVTCIKKGTQNNRTIAVSEYAHELHTMYSNGPKKVMFNTKQLSVDQTY